MPTGTLLQLRGKPKSTPQQKVDWLLAHQELWEGWPDDVTIRDNRKRSIVEAMKKDGIVAPSTYWVDIHLTNLIQEARRQRRSKNAK